MKRGLLRLMGFVMAGVMMVGSAMTAFAEEAEYAEAGEQDVAVTATISDADVSWFKVKIPTEIALAYDASVTSSTRASMGDGYVVYSGDCDIFVKGFIPAGKKVSVSIPSVETLTGQTDPSLTFSLSNAIIVDSTASGLITAHYGNSADWYSESFEGTPEDAYVPAVKMSSEYALAGSTPYASMHALGLNPKAQVYSGNVTFTISYGDV